MKTITKSLILFMPFIFGFARASDQSQATYFSVYNDFESGNISEQFVVKITDPSLIAQARAMLNLPQAERASVRGTVVKAPAYFSAPWSFHLDPISVDFFDLSAEVCDASTSYVEEHLSEVGEAFLPANAWCPWSSKLLAEVPEPAGSANYLRVASAASNRESAISPGALISIYGQNLTDRMEQADPSAPPLTLAGVTVQIMANGKSAGRQIPLLFASPSQVNALIPADVLVGAVSISLTNTSGGQFAGASYLDPVAPALFFVSQENLNYAAGTLLRVSADGTRFTQSLTAVDPGSGNLIPVPIDFGSPSDQLYLSLYGTGISNAKVDSVSLSLGSEDSPILFAGPQGQSTGLDQVNVALPQSLSSQSFVDVQLTVKNPYGFPVIANAVRILLGGSAGSSSRSRRTARGSGGPLERALLR